MSVAVAAEWWHPQYAVLVARPDCPAWARAVLDRLGEESSRAPKAFGGWGGELLLAADGRFVLIDWPGLGAAPEARSRQQRWRSCFATGPQTRRPSSNDSWPA